MSFATATLDFSLNAFSLNSLSIIVILFVSLAKPAPLSCREFKIIASKFFLFSLPFAFSNSLLVSNAKPTKYCCFFIAPKDAKISLVGNNDNSNVVSVFFILWEALFFGL